MAAPHKEDVSDFELDNYRYRVIVAAEDRACQLEKIARLVRSGTHPAVTAEAIEILAQSMRQHGALVALELAHSRRGILREDEHTIRTAHLKLRNRVRRAIRILLYGSEK
jgi:hypothetical protein